MNDYKSNLKIQVLAPTQNYQVVEFHGDLDKAGLDDNRVKIEKIIENFPLQYLIFDLTDLNFINSEGIGFTMMIHSHLAKLGKTLMVVNAKPNVKDIFQVIGLFNIVQYSDSLVAALSKLSA